MIRCLWPTRTLHGASSSTLNRALIATTRTRLPGQIATRNVQSLSPETQHTAQLSDATSTSSGAIAQGDMCSQPSSVATREKEAVTWKPLVDTPISETSADNEPHWGSRPVNNTHRRSRPIGFDWDSADSEWDTAHKGVEKGTPGNMTWQPPRETYVLATYAETEAQPAVRSVNHMSRKSMATASDCNSAESEPVNVAAKIEPSLPEWDNYNTPERVLDPELSLPETSNYDALETAPKPQPKPEPEPKLPDLDFPRPERIGKAFSDFKTAAAAACPLPYRIGVDICDISRVAKMIDGHFNPQAYQKFSSRVLTIIELRLHDTGVVDALERLAKAKIASRLLKEGVKERDIPKPAPQQPHSERKRKRAEFLAGRWAAKEAIIKAMSAAADDDGGRKTYMHDIVILPAPILKLVDIWDVDRGVFALKKGKKFPEDLSKVKGPLRAFVRRGPDESSNSWQEIGVSISHDRDFAMAVAFASNHPPKESSSETGIGGRQEKVARKSVRDPLVSPPDPEAKPHNRKYRRARAR